MVVITDKDKRLFIAVVLYFRGMIKSMVNDTTYEVEFEEGSTHQGTVNGAPFSLDEISEGPGRYHVLWENRSFRVEVLEADMDAKNVTLRVNGNKYVVEVRDRFDQLLRQLGLHNMGAAAVNDIKAPMPGLVLRVEAGVGDEVKKGEPLLVLEAMKMENVIKSPVDGSVKAVKVADGDAVEKNQVLVEFA